MADERDPELPGLLLRTERDELLPLLRSAADSDFALRTACPGWTVRDVVAHCGSVLSRVVESRFEPDVFSPECNDRDIAERAGWTHTEVVDELERGMTDAGPAIAAAGGVLDAVALGEWVHAGDVRAAWGLPGAYEGPGLPHALRLLVPRALRRKTPLLVAELTDSGQEQELTIGAEQEGRAPGRYRGDGATLIRLCAARPLVGTRYELEGVRERELCLFD
ncbi:maleylpyruvate isomerase family mycothiol-dependent enzyme [Streptomyces sp. NPDC005426]|uniref:maleylpyruvate isomerase family mycothiol-dependent enzyme n=1 Tax=unclassified Streptomyces TaxID=2593676 RepID=UPI0033A15462